MDDSMFQRILIIGVGLIGSSILRRLKKNSSVKKIVAYDNNKSVREIIKKLNISDEISSISLINSALDDVLGSSEYNQSISDRSTNMSASGNCAILAAN